jgi:hypothetical protein
MDGDLGDVDRGLADTHRTHLGPGYLTAGCGVAGQAQDPYAAVQISVDVTTGPADQLRRRPIAADHLDDGLTEPGGPVTWIGQPAGVGAEARGAAAGQNRESWRRRRRRSRGHVTGKVESQRSLHIRAGDPHANLRDAHRDSSWRPAHPKGRWVRCGHPTPRETPLGACKTVPGMISPGSSPITDRLAAYHRGHSAATSASPAPRPSCRAAICHSVSP